MGSLSARSRTQQSVSLSFAEAEFYALTTGIADGMVMEHLLKQLGHEVTVVNHVDSQSAKAWASKRGVRSDETCNVEVHVRANCRGEEANDTCPCQHEFEQGAHEKMRHVGSEAQQRRRKTRLKQSH